MLYLFIWLVARIRRRSSGFQSNRLLDLSTLVLSQIGGNKKLKSGLKPSAAKQSENGSSWPLGTTRPRRPPRLRRNPSRKKARHW